ncbi:MAG TPA: hypothetical protein VJ801_17270, partial [Polyangia bacterium]|nr:hypothetical protein [Polyangia bacterium]
MSEPAGLAAFISLSKPAFARFLAGAGGDEAARLFAAASANPDAMLALRYVAKHRGVLFCAFDDETSPPEWLDSAAFEVCRLLAQAKDNASEDLVLVSAGILNHRVDEIAFAFAAGGGLVAPLQPVPGWDDPRLVVLDRLLEELVFAPLAKAEDRPLDKLVDASVRRLARSRLQRQLVEERASAIR